MPRRAIAVARRKRLLSVLSVESSVRDMKVLDLFSGIGGFSLGLERAGMETVAFCEIDKFCQRVLKKHWPEVPIYDDITQLDGEQFRGSVDLVCGGFPCQGFSLAGQRRGKTDDRYLWPEMFRIIREVRPAYVIGENVAGIISLALDTVLSDLEGENYTCQTFVIPACAVNAPHRRDRVWIIAYDASANDRRHNTESTKRQASKSRESDCSGLMADSDGIDEQRLIPNVAHSKKRKIQRARQARSCSDGTKSGAPKPQMGRVVSRLPRGLDGIIDYWPINWESGTTRVATDVKNKTNRLKALGNAVVPAIPEILGQAILTIEGRS